MEVRVLGCSGSIAAGCPTTSFLLDDDVLVDAGTGVGSLSLEALCRIDHVLLSHSHLDHVAALPLLADCVLRTRRAEGCPPIQVHALPQTLEALQRHLFNGIIWPDFSRIPSPERPVLRFVPVAVGQLLTLGRRLVEVLPAVHTVPGVGYAVWDVPSPKHTHARQEVHPLRPEDLAGGWVYTGDTGPNPALWKRLAQLSVAQVVIEAAFGDDDWAVAEVSGHLHPEALGRELIHLSPEVQVWLTHIKPGDAGVVKAQMRALGLHQTLGVLTPGVVMRPQRPPRIGTATFQRNTRAAA